MPNKSIIFILGYARSGTSALTRVISLCGLALPERVFGATELNPTGHWEPVIATNLNLEFLSRYLAVDDPRMVLDDLSVSEGEKERFIGGIQRFLSECPKGPLVIKEFRINELLPFWLEAATREGYAPKALIALRCPGEVASSISAGTNVFHRGVMASLAPPGTSIETIHAFWLKTNLLAERHTRNVPRAVIEYPNLLSDWRKEVARISGALEVDLYADEPAIDSFLTPKLHRQRSNGVAVERFCYSWVTRVYATLFAAARDAPFDTNSLDEVYDAYSLAARTFGIVFDGVLGKDRARLVRDFVDGLPIWIAGQDF